MEGAQPGAGVREAAMGLRAHRRNPVVWSLSAGHAGSYGAPRLARPAGARRIRRFVRTGALLTVLGLIHLARGVRRRWFPLLAGAVLTTAGIAVRDSVWSVVAIPGLWLLAYALMIPAGPSAERAELERELAAYSTPAERRDLEAMLDRYPDDVTRELRELLAGQALSPRHGRIPGGGQY